MMDDVDPMPNPEAEINIRIAGYIDVLSVHRDAEAARDYYTEDFKLRGPGFEFDQPTVVRELQAAFDAGARIEVDRQTLELFVHDDVAYEIAKAEDTLVFPDGSSQTLRNNMFIRWERGSDGVWRFSRVLLGPQDAATQHDA